MKEKIRTHIFIMLWPTPWTWCRPKFKRWKTGDWTLCFGFGQIEKIRDY